MDVMRELGLVVRGAPESWAAFSPCERYRYALGRCFEPMFGPGRTMSFVLHNPSTATETLTDPTLTRCVRFAKREGCASLVFTNVMAWRSTDKKPLLLVPDPVGPQNAAAIADVLAVSARIVFAWGIIDPPISIR